MQRQQTSTRSFRGWPRVRVATREGETDGIAPVIISASRATDIPAFYADWFMHRLRAGFVRWVNRFSGRAQQVSFEKARAVVFWTKNAQPMMKHLPELDARGINYYFTFTLNDYEAEGLEPKVPALASRIDTFRRLAEKLGPQRVVWRFDPLILTGSISVDGLLEKIYRVGNQIHRHTEKLVISFIDIGLYRKVRRNLLAAGFRDCREFAPDDISRIAGGLQSMNRQWGLMIATCAEALDLSDHGIRHNKCIDDELMTRLFNRDRALMDFLGCVPPEGGISPLLREDEAAAKIFKDPGQRKDCGCVPSKDIGHYDTCAHACLYCYANSSPEIAGRNHGRHKERGRFHESILGG